MKIEYEHVLDFLIYLALVFGMIVMAAIGAPWAMVICVFVIGLLVRKNAIHDRGTDCTSRDLARERLKNVLHWTKSHLYR